MSTWSLKEMMDFIAPSPLPEKGSKEEAEIRDLSVFFSAKITLEGWINRELIDDMSVAYRTNDWSVVEAKIDGRIDSIIKQNPDNRYKNTYFRDFRKKYLDELKYRLAQENDL